VQSDSLRLLNYDVVACRMVILERCLRRLEWEKVKEKENREAADQLEAERMAMQSLDW
jgi:splicing factor 3A subunit 1